MVDKQRADREDTEQPKQKKSKKGNGTENAQKNENHPANQSARPTDNGLDEVGDILNDQSLGLQERITAVAPTHRC